MRSVIPTLSPKRTRSAIEASTMRSALETTRVRRRYRASQWRCREWSRSMPCVSSLPTNQPPLRDQLGVGRPVVRAVETDAPALQALEQSFESGLVTTAQLPVDDPSGSALPSLPDPALVPHF